MRIRNLSIIAILFSLSLVMLAPIFWIIAVSVMERRDLFSIPPDLIFEPTNKYYIDVFVNKDGWKELFISVRDSTLIATFSVLLSLPLLLSEIINRSMGRNFTGMLLLFFALPASILAIPYFIYTSFFGISQYIAYLVGLTATASIVVFLIVSRYTSNIRGSSSDIIRLHLSQHPLLAGKIVFLDAAGPLSLAAILAFLIVWQDLIFGLVFSTGDFKPLNVSIIGLVTPVGTYWGEIAARSCAAILISALLALPLTRFIEKGFLVSK